VRRLLLHKGGFERVVDYAKAIEDCFIELKQSGQIRDENDLAAVGFKTIMARGVNGCVRLDGATWSRRWKPSTGFAPAHNPPYITGIRLFAKRMPQVALVGLFETAFYQWLPEAAVRYAVPEEWHELGVRRWGFHGASHKFIAERSAELLGEPMWPSTSESSMSVIVQTEFASRILRVISCHLGGSSSITGILMELPSAPAWTKPAIGSSQNNRVGDLDSFALPFLMRSGGLSLEQAEKLCAKNPG